ncbi:hypothetical protein BD289DRAFT_277656 [Coniella lustricola]|uniref:Uncharacterized protein n=1 Tax=Coniella lustricola TaxID=2025994 RepID=A0A2T3A6J6_9PEZI|nr:hypothetical protein BD289DRAFT_277656 [Coniella lustricola]
MLGTERSTRTSTRLVQARAGRGNRRQRYDESRRQANGSYKEQERERAGAGADTGPALLNCTRSAASSASAGASASRPVSENHAVSMGITMTVSVVVVVLVVNWSWKCSRTCRRRRTQERTYTSPSYLGPGFAWPRFNVELGAVDPRLERGRRGSECSMCRLLAGFQVLGWAEQAVRWMLMGAASPAKPRDGILGMVSWC